MKAVILAGGTGSRLFPLTKVTSKQLLPVGNKPLIYYPLSIPMLVGIKDVLIISQESMIPQFKNILGNGADFGMNIEYIAQNEPLGLAHGLNLSKDFVGKDDFIFLLGDNIVHGHGLTKKIKEAIGREGSTMFAYKVENPQSFGVINHDDNGVITMFEEKPKNPKSEWASIGLYVFKNNIFEYYPSLKPSDRGELELPDLVSLYMKENKAYIEKLGRGFAWFDAGTLTNFQLANSYIISHEMATNAKIASLEELGYNNGWISKAMLAKLIKGNKSEYFEYLKGVLND